jgi:hypothetical protein
VLRRSASQTPVRARSQTIRAAERSAPSELMVYRRVPSAVRHHHILLLTSALSSSSILHSRHVGTIHAFGLQAEVASDWGNI